MQAPDCTPRLPNEHDWHNPDFLQELEHVLQAVQKPAGGGPTPALPPPLMEIPTNIPPACPAPHTAPRYALAPAGCLTPVIKPAAHPHAPAAACSHTYTSPTHALPTAQPLAPALAHAPAPAMQPTATQFPSAAAGCITPGLPPVIQPADLQPTAVCAGVSAGCDHLAEHRLPAHLAASAPTLPFPSSCGPQPNQLPQHQQVQPYVGTEHSTLGMQGSMPPQSLQQQQTQSYADSGPGMHGLQGGMPPQYLQQQQTQAYLCTEQSMQRSMPQSLQQHGTRPYPEAEQSMHSMQRSMPPSLQQQQQAPSNIAAEQGMQRAMPRSLQPPQPALPKPHHSSQPLSAHPPAQRLQPLLQFKGRVRCAETPEEAEYYAAEMAALRPAMIGLDCEWRAPSDTHAPVAMLQLCCHSEGGDKQEAPHELSGRHCLCVLFHVTHCWVPPALKALLADPLILKTGVNIIGDVRRMQQDWAAQVCGWVELNAVANSRQLGHIPMVTADTERWDRSLPALVKLVLGPTLAKPRHIRMSNWEMRPLSQEHKDYAATDAWAGLAVYWALLRLPPRAAH